MLSEARRVVGTCANHISKKDPAVDPGPVQEDGACVVTRRHRSILLLVLQVQSRECFGMLGRCLNWMPGAFGEGSLSLP